MAPACVAYVPAAQVAQRPDDASPSPVAKVPAAHAVQLAFEAFPAFWKVTKHDWSFLLLGGQHHTLVPSVGAKPLLLAEHLSTLWHFFVFFCFF